MPKEEVKLKGVAYPVQTYQVIDRIDHLSSKQKKLMSESKDFEVQLDSGAIDAAEKARIREVLAQAMKMLK